VILNHLVMMMVEEEIQYSTPILPFLVQQ